MKRVVPLEGGRNFRDLGGYETRDGRRLKWGCLYRSGVLSYLTEEDRRQLDQLGIHTLCDLRTGDEREREPTRWECAQLQRFTWDYDKRQVSLRALLEGAGFSAPQAHGAMIKLYRQIPRVFSQQYAAVFDRLAGGDLPLLFNCSAGKDRTGVLAALILSSVGVPREHVVADYVLTDTACDLEKALFDHPEGSIGLGDEYTFLLRAPRADRRPLFISSPEYLQASFDQIELDYGSLDNYLQSVLGQTAQSLARIRTNLLETA